MNLDWTVYRRLLAELPFGKRLPTAVYIHRSSTVCMAGSIGALLDHLAALHKLGSDFNVIKFRTDALRLSFLSYPSFDNRAHPELAAAVAIDLQTGKAFRTDYSDNLNPPILHRKELFVPPDHPRRQEYKALSEAEEAQGLYGDTTIIGFRANWEAILAERGLALEGHTLINTLINTDVSVVLSEGPRRTIDRHLTALTRYSLSKPVKTLLEYGQLPEGATVFDYGCGRGADVRGLRELGHDADGWDPVHCPQTEKREADVVNLGYVLNVVEDPAERLRTLSEAWRLTKRLLVVSTLVRGGPPSGVATSFGDGVLTRRNTFQKYFDQRELQQYLEDALERLAVPIALGIFYVFRETEEHQRFLSARSRRVIDWRSIAATFERPERPPRTPRPSQPDRYEAHTDLVEAFWHTCIDLGRLALPSEFPRHQELTDVFGSAKRALTGLLRRGRTEAFESAQAGRKNDLLVYLAAANLRRKVAFSDLPESTREDVRAFFGSYGRGLAEGLELLRAAADPPTIRLACDDASVGWQDDSALYVHASLICRLPPVLRAYVACAEVLFGDARQTDLVKMHKSSGKVSFLSYKSFDTSPLPELQVRTKVNLRALSVDVFDHAGHGELLYFKERYVPVEHPQRHSLRELSLVLRQLGLDDTEFLGPTLSVLQAMVVAHPEAHIVSEALSADATWTTQ